ncbi:protein-glutamate methylesterase/protein-glutamine glutaminase [Vallicoccus soli]|uniref:Protein-glutamate methylesterase/protein-glutamine glutaminase n=1 Tax=Vallicoccus soli TaxID=2339232 RepID=A0A3A3YLZ2_9ACTN|nr:chemotaxis response regulator protein-glutamate methylesterase [Vallicoccus soli]RJK92449.1 chemotaxis response regulator protein-glutamate methylesterase [Vallicoccus soli]
MINVLVVDDSTVVRRLVTASLEEDPAIRIVGTAANGRIALSKLDQVAPDVVTLDIEMPVMDGLATLREIRRLRPTLPVIMFSTLTERGGQATLEALSAGASDYVTKPSNVGAIAESMRAVREQLVPRIKALHAAARPAPPRPPLRSGPRPGGPAAPYGAPGPSGPAGRSPLGTAPGRPAPGAAPARPAAPAAPAGPPAKVEVVAVGCSTGGPEALAKVVAGLPRDLPVPVVVVQHMPPLFTRLFAERLDRLGTLRVAEAADGVPLRPGHVYVAPGDRHLEVVRSGGAVQTRLTDAPPENFCRPAVDVLFRSVAQAYGGAALAVVLTGMGSDGRRGCEPLRAAGCRVIVQDAATSVVWGMPGAVSGAGLATAELPLDRIAGAVGDAVLGTTVHRGARAAQGGA